MHSQYANGYWLRLPRWQIEKRPLAHVDKEHRDRVLSMTNRLLAFAVAAFLLSVGSIIFGA